MNECAYGSRAGHCIRQPGVQRYLSTFTRSPQKKQQCDPCNVEGRKPGNICKYIKVVACAKFGYQQECRQQKPEITDTVHDKCLFCGRIVIVILKPKSNQQIRTQPNAFPTN